MRRSSVIALAAAAAMSVVALAIWSAPSTRVAPPLTPKVVHALLDEGKRRLEQKDVDGILALFSRDARIFNRTPAQIRPLLEDAMAELGSGSLTVTFSLMEIEQSAEGAVVSVSMDVAERFKHADASYFRPRVWLLLQKKRTNRLFGIYSVEEWRIQRLDSDENFDLRSA